MSAVPERATETGQATLAPERADERKAWLTRKERGGVLAIRFTVFLATVFGRTIGRLITLPVTLYYVLTSPEARRALRIFYERLGEGPASFGRIYRHMLRFVRCTLDAFFLVAGKIHRFRVTRTGHQHLEALRVNKRGAILLGAHVGSFYAMRIQGHAEQLPLYALMYTGNARMLNDALRKLDPEGSAQILELDPDGGMDGMLKVKELLDQGALIAILGDRIPKNAPPDRVMKVPFLGKEAAFPAGPLLLAATLKCPVYLTFGIARDPDTYDLYCEPFAERIDLPRGDRMGALRGWVAKYAAALEEKVRKHPDNWFNFYDFWG